MPWRLFANTIKMAVSKQALLSTENELILHISERAFDTFVMSLKMFHRKFKTTRFDVKNIGKKV